MSSIKRTVLTLLAAVLIGGCTESGSSDPVPGPVAMTEEAVGHYCSMNILEHEGPKAQIHLKGIEHPIWFSQVRDAVAYLRSPEEHLESVVVYVHDMAKADSWARPGDDAWIDSTNAVFVIGSRKTGGMGTPEVIPFASINAAETFIAEFGGKSVSLSDIPDEYVLGQITVSASGHNDEEHKQ